MVLALSHLEEEKIRSYKRDIERIKALPTSQDRKVAFIRFYNGLAAGDLEEEYFFERHVVGEGAAALFIGKGPIQEQPNRLRYLLEYFDLV